MIFRRIAALLLAWFILPVPAGAEEEVNIGFPQETPAPVRLLREEPEPTQEMPELINRISDPDAGESFHFYMDSRILHIWFPDIANADEAVLVYDGEVWMLDCGDERMGARGAAMLQWLGITEVQRLFNSHPHHDHLNGLQATCGAARVEELDICFDRDETTHMVKALEYAEQNGIRIGTYRFGDVRAMGDRAVTLTFYVGPESGMDLNNRSAVTMVRYGERTILFTADIEFAGETWLMENVEDRDLKADLLRYPHHGKKRLDEAFFRAVSPEAAIITNKSVPDWEGPKYLKARDIPCIYTGVTGSYLHLMTDGEHWIMEYVPYGAEESPAPPQSP